MMWPRGKCLGGSTAINGLYMTRPSATEIGAWQGLLGGMDGSENWSWGSFLGAMKTSEDFTPPLPNVASEADITYNAASHGTTGPLHMSYPGYQFEINAQYLAACANAGIAKTADGYNGDNTGAYVVTSSIDPENWTRSYSKSAYLDPLGPRSNYEVLTNALVTRVMFDGSSAGNLKANAVEYSTNGGGSTTTVKVNKEVILAGGTIASPAILQYSGIGPKDVLSAAGVDVLLDLPGVGAHLQDHLSVQTQWSTTEQTAGALHQSGDNDPQFLSYVNDAVAFVSGPSLFGGGLNALQSSVLSNEGQYATATDPTVEAGYKAVYSTIAQDILTSDSSGYVELLLENTASNDTIFLQVTLQHPYSQGSVYITGSNPTTYPTIDPNYFANPADMQITIQGLKLARKIAQTAPLSGVLTETVPGPDVQTDAQWEDFVRANTYTEFHPAGTCSMLPLEQGGVVDANLMVYGIANVRVADASVHPFLPSAHLMSSTYGIGEQASNIIRAFWDGK